MKLVSQSSGIVGIVRKEHPIKIISGTISGDENPKVTIVLMDFNGWSTE